MCKCLNTVSPYSSQSIQGLSSLSHAYYGIKNLSFLFAIFFINMIQDTCIRIMEIFPYNCVCYGEIVSSTVYIENIQFLEIVLLTIMYMCCKKKMTG